MAIYESVAGADPAAVALGLNNLGSLFQYQGRLAEAEPLLERSLAIYEKAFGVDKVGLSLNNLATLYMAQGRDTKAELLLKRSIALYEKARSDDPEGLMNLAQLYSNHRRYAEAAPLLKRALAMQEKVFGTDHPVVAGTFVRLASLYRSQGQPGPALASSRRATGIIASHFAAEAADRTLGTDVEQRGARSFFLQNISLVYAAGGTGTEAETFRDAQLGHASSTSQAVANAAVRFAAGTDPLAIAVRERQDLAEHWRRSDAALLIAVSQPPNKRDATGEAALRADLAAAGQRLDALDARLAKDFPQYAELCQPRPIDLDAAQALLAPDEALLVYLVGGDESWLWVLRRDRTAMHRIAIGAKALDRVVTQLRSSLDSSLFAKFATLNDVPAFDVAAAFELYQRIFAPAEPLLADAKTLFVVPDGALESLPLSVLVTRKTASPVKDFASYKSVPWLARRYAVTVLPAISSLRALRAFAKAQQAREPFVGYGDPVFRGDSDSTRGVALAKLFRGGQVDIAQLRDLPRLPDTARELRTIRGPVASRAPLHQRASRQGRHGDGGQAGQSRRYARRRLRHARPGGQGSAIAGRTGTRSPTPPANPTPADDGLLTASDVSQLKLSADWVVLSACNTAAPDGGQGADGLSGLAKAFFYAGARSLLVSHWPVDSVATVRLTTGAFDELEKDKSMGRAEALRRSMISMSDQAAADPKESYLAHPMFWAPFIVVGEGGHGH